MQGQAHHILLDAEQLEVFQVQVDHGQELLLELFFGKVNVGVVHLHRADAHQPEQFPRLLITVTRPVFR